MTISYFSRFSTTSFLLALPLSLYPRLFPIPLSHTQLSRDRHRQPHRFSFVYDCFIPYLVLFCYIWIFSLYRCFLVSAKKMEPIDEGNVFAVEKLLKERKRKVGFSFCRFSRNSTWKVGIDFCNSEISSESEKISFQQKKINNLDFFVLGDQKSVSTCFRNEILVLILWYIFNGFSF